MNFQVTSNRAVLLALAILGGAACTSGVDNSARSEVVTGLTRGCGAAVVVPARPAPPPEPPAVGMCR